MKRVIGSLVVMFFFLSQVGSTVISDGPYMIAHRDNYEDAFAYWKHAYERTLIHDDMTLVYVGGYDRYLSDVHHEQLSCTSSSINSVSTTFIDAVNENLVGEIWWIVPDHLYQEQHLDQMDTFVCQESGLGDQLGVYNCEKEGDHIVCKLNSGSLSAQSTTTPVHFVTLDMLPPLEGEVLLDIDVDYFYRNGTSWISVDTFMNALTALQIRSRMVTIGVHHSNEEYVYLSWIITGRINEYLSGFYGCSMKKKSFSIA